MSFEDAYRALLEQKFKPTSKRGFEIIEYLDESLRAKFIERIDIRETITDPFGNESSLELTRYSVFEFNIYHLHKNDYILYVTNPPKSIKNFLKIMYDILGFGFFIKSLTFELKGFFKAIEELLKPTQTKVTRVSASGLVLSETSSAKLEIKSTKHAYYDLEKYYRSENFIIDNIRVSLRLDGVEGLIEASKSGFISFSTDYLSDIERLVTHLNSEA